MPKEFINTEVLQTLFTILSKQDFENLYKSKAIDIKSEAFKDLALKHYELQDNKFALKAIGNNPIIKLLISHSYSENLSSEEIAEIYQKLYNLPYYPALFN